MKKIQRTNGMPTTADIIINSEYAPEKVKFAAAQGKQGRFVTWSIQMPFVVLADLFEVDENDLAILRSQRPINLNRAKKVTSYLMEDSQEYVLPSLTATIEDDIPTTQSLDLNTHMNMTSGDFTTCAINVDMPEGEINGTLTILEVPQTSRWWFIDGQHRATGIKGLKLMCIQAGMSIETMYPLDTVSVMCRIDTGINMRQLHFSTINGTMIKPNGSLNALYGQQSKAAGIYIANSIKYGIDGSLIEYDKTTCSGSTPKLFPYKTLVDTSLVLLNRKVTDDVSELESEYLKLFWKTYSNFDELKGKRASELRFESVISYSVMITAFGLVGRWAHDLNIDFDQFFAALNQKIDYSRTAPHWVGLCIDAEGKLVKKAGSIRKTADYLIEICKKTAVYKRAIKDKEVFKGK